MSGFLIRLSCDACLLTLGKYLVTGDREVTTVLTVQADGTNWELLEGTLHDVTHLPCRSARYIATGGSAGGEF